MKNGWTKKIVGTALFAALSFAVSLLEFPIFPAAPFLKLDFSAVFTLLGGFMYGPIAGICICAVKEIIRFILGSATGGIGEIANFLVTSYFILVPTVVYRFKTGIKVVVLTLIIAIFLQVGVALLSNRFIMFPLYMGENAGEYFDKLWYWVALFNLIKGVAISVIVFLLYKRVSWLFLKIKLHEKRESDIIETSETDDSESQGE